MTLCVAFMTYLLRNLSAVKASTARSAKQLINSVIMVFISNHKTK